MEARLRGTIEQFIDDRLTDDELAKLKGMSESFESSGTPFDERTALGVLIGYTWGRVAMTCLMWYDRPPNSDEIEDYYHILNERMPGIITKIKKAWNL